MRAANYGAAYARDSLIEYGDGGVSVSAATATQTKCPLRTVSRGASWATLSNDEVQITKGGLYVVATQVLFSFISATGTRRVELWKNGSLYDWAETPGNGGGNSIYKSGPYQLQLRAGDYLAVYGRQDTGSSQPLFGKIVVQRIALDGDR